MNKRHKFKLFTSLKGGLLLALLILISGTTYLNAQKKGAEQNIREQQPKNEQPMFQLQNSEQPKSQQSNSGQPKNEQPMFRQQNSGQPKNEQPMFQQQNSEQSKSQQSNSEQPNSEQPNSQQSNSEQPNSQQSNSGQPKNEQPMFQQQNSKQSNSGQSKSQQLISHQPKSQRAESAQSIIAKKAAAIKPLADGSIRFAYLADIHIAEGGTAVEDIIQSVKDINNQKDIQFVILAGDITEFGSDEEIAIAAKIFSQFNKPWFILSGNHDSKWSESGCNTFAKVFGYEFFNFVVDPIRGGYADFGKGSYSDSGNSSYADSGNGRFADSGNGRNADAGRGGDAASIRFIGCNSGPNMRMAPALVPRESILILDSVAKTIPSDQPVIFINHYPLGDEMLNWFEVTDILKRMNTQLALCGHGHNNTALDYQGLPGVMGRSNLRAGRPGPGYNIVTIKNGLIDFRERIIPVLKESGAPNESGTFNTTALAAVSASATTASAAASASATTAPAAASASAATARSVTDISAYTKTQFSEAKTQTPWFRLRMSGATPFAFNKNSKNDVETQLTFERKQIGKDILGLTYDGNAQMTGDQKGKSIGTSGQKDSPGSEGRGVRDRTKIKELWSVQDNSDIGSAALYENDVVYYANTAGTIKAWDVKNNRLLWSYATGSKIFSTPALSEGRLVIGCTDNNIYCLDSKSGKELWRVRADKSVLASPAIYKGVVYIGASDGIFRAIDLKSGRLRWQFTGVDSFVESKAWVDDSGVYFGSWGSQFYALNTKSGKLLWSWTNSKGRGLSPAAVWPVKAGGDLNSGRNTNNRPLSGNKGGVIYFVTPERMTHALDAHTGKELWRAKGGREAIGISPDASVVYVKTMQDTLIAYRTGLPAATGNDTPKMSSSRNAPQRQADVVSNPKSAPQQKRESAAQPRLSTPSAQPQPLWKSHVGFGYEIAPSPLTATEELIFVPTDKGSIFAVRASDGKPVWQYKFSIALINYVQILPGHRLLVSSMDGKVAILQY